MSSNKNALIRYKTLDKCLRNQYKKYTLEDLINECSEALFEFEGKESAMTALPKCRQTLLDAFNA